MTNLSIDLERFSCHCLETEDYEPIHFILIFIFEIKKVKRGEKSQKMNFTIFVDERNFEEYDDSPILNEVCSRLILYKSI